MKQHVQQANWVKFVNPSPSKLSVLKISNCFHPFFLCVWVCVIFLGSLYSKPPPQNHCGLQSHIHQRIFPPKKTLRKKKKHPKASFFGELCEHEHCPGFAETGQVSEKRRRVGRMKKVWKPTNTSTQQTHHFGMSFF